MSDPSAKRAKAESYAGESTPILGMAHPCLDALVDLKDMMASAHGRIVREKRFSAWASDPGNVSELGKMEITPAERSGMRLVSALGLKPVS